MVLQTCLRHSVGAQTMRLHCLRYTHSQKPAMSSGAGTRILQRRCVEKARAVVHWREGILNGAEAVCAHVCTDHTQQKSYKILCKTPMPSLHGRHWQPPPRVPCLMCRSISAHCNTCTAAPALLHVAAWHCHFSEACSGGAAGVGICVGVWRCSNTKASSA